MNDQPHLPPNPARVFLDANVMYAACLAPSGGSAKLWSTGALMLVTSEYALREAWENLVHQADGEALRVRLLELVERVEVIPHDSIATAAARAWSLPDPTDVPILEGAIAARCAYLATLDIACFGEFYNTQVDGVTIIKPGKLLARLGL